MEEQVSNELVLCLVTGKNAGNLSSLKDLHASRRLEFSFYSAPFTITRNRELSGKYFPVACHCSPRPGRRLHAAKAERGLQHAAYVATARGISLSLNKIAPPAGSGRAGKPAWAEGMVGTDKADQTPA